MHTYLFSVASRVESRDVWFEPRKGLLISTHLLQEYFLLSQKMSGLEMKLTGVMGKRRKHQVTSVANLALHAKSEKTGDAATPISTESSVPKVSRCLYGLSYLLLLIRPP